MHPNKSAAIALHPTIGKYIWYIKYLSIQLAMTIYMVFDVGHFIVLFQTYVVMPNNWGPERCGLMSPASIFELNQAYGNRIEIESK